MSESKKKDGSDGGDNNNNDDFRYVEIEPLVVNTTRIESASSRTVSTDGTTLRTMLEKAVRLPPKSLVTSPSSSKSKREADEKPIDPDDFDIAILERDEEYFYGWGPFRPSFLQFCRNPYVVMVAVCLCTFAQTFGILGVFPSAASHLQLRFHLSPTDIGLIRMFYDIGACAMIIPVLYFGVKGANRPKWIGAGAFTVGLSALLFTVPQFVIGPYVPPKDHFHGCETIEHARNHGHHHHDESEACRDAKTATSFKYLFMVATLLYGMGVTPTNTMGLTYLDENVNPEMSSIFTGIFMLCGLIGPAFGYLTATGLLQINGDVLKPSMIRSAIKSDDNRFYGAWWIGMLVTTLLTWIAAVPISGFPHRLPGAMRAQQDGEAKRWIIRQRKLQTESEAGSSDASKVSGADYKRLKAGDFDVFRLRRCIELLRNPSYVGLMIDYSLQSFLVTTFGTFMPAYIHEAFRISIIRAAGWSAGIVIVAVVSLLFGVGLQRLLRLDVKGNIRLSLFASAAGMLFMLTFLVHCTVPSMTGFTPSAAYKTCQNMSSPSTNKSLACNHECHCPQDHYHPVCYERDNRMFFSECFAGCRTENKTHFLNCSCVASQPIVATARKMPQRNKTTTRMTTMTPTVETCGGGAVLKGVCNMDKTCPKKRFYAFFIGLSWIVFTLYVRMNPLKQSLLRSVPFHQRIVSLAIGGAFSRIFGSIPASPIFGRALDDACDARMKSCDQEGECVWSNPDELYKSALLIGGLVSFLSVLGLVLALVKYKEPVFSEPGDPKLANEDAAKTMDEQRWITEMI